MASTVTLSYYAPIVPSTLPTNAEIDSAPDISLAYGGRRIVDVGDHFVVEFGVGVDLIEGENMLFVQEHAEGAVPRVYALYSTPETGKNYIVMEQIASQTLLSLWEHLSTAEKETIVKILRSNFSKLRRLPSSHYYGSLVERYLLDELSWTTDAKPMINGSFAFNDIVNEAMVRKYTYDGGPPYRAEFCVTASAQHLPTVIFKGRIS